jgi:hypothetical protein
MFCLAGYHQLGNFHAGHVGYIQIWVGSQSENGVLHVWQNRDSCHRSTLTFKFEPTEIKQPKNYTDDQNSFCLVAILGFILNFTHTIEFYTNK